MAIYYLPKSKLFEEVKKRLKIAEVILDVGCGIYPQQLIKPRVHICMEPYSPYLIKLKQKVKNEFDRSFVFVNANWEAASKLFPPKSIDTIFLLDVIEHLEKAKALKLLRKAEHIARTQIIIFTPLGFIKQFHPKGEDAWGLRGGKWQEHKSGFEPSDFDKSWDIFISDRFHSRDNMGKDYTKPHGAFFAIKNLTNFKKKVNVSENLESKYLKSEKKLMKVKGLLIKTQAELKEIQVSRGWKIISILHRLRLSLPILRKI